MKKQTETKKLALKGEKIRKLNLVRIEKQVNGGALDDGAGGGGASRFYIDYSAIAISYRISG